MFWPNSYYFQINHHPDFSISFKIRTDFFRLSLNSRLVPSLRRDFFEFVPCHCSCLLATHNLSMSHLSKTYCAHSDLRKTCPMFYFSFQNFLHLFSKIGKNDKLKEKINLPLLLFCVSYQLDCIFCCGCPWLWICYLRFK